MVDLPRDELILSIGGVDYGGWTDASVSVAIDTICGGFEFTLAEREPGKDRPFAFEAGAACMVKIGGETLISGWIDEITPSFDPEGHKIGISGRDRAGDLVDCSAIHNPGSWINTALETIAAELAKPFGINVTARASTAPKIKRFALQQGEGVFEAIERLCRYRGLLPISTPAGDVELIAIDPSLPAVARIAQGVNIKSASAEHNVSERFSKYILKGQASGDDDANGRAVSGVKAEATDPAIKRHRPLLIIGEEQSTIGGLEKRARWEATTRAGKGQSASVTIPGWRAPGGTLWARGTMVDLFAPWLLIDSKMLVVEVTHSIAEDSRSTELRLSPPEAFSQLPVSEDAEASRVGKAK